MKKSILLLHVLGLTLISLSAINPSHWTNIEKAREGQHIIIAPAGFLPQAHYLADFYWNEFQITRIVVDQQDIFDQMSDGEAEPGAIRDYLIAFFDDPEVWSESSVLLMGSGTLDWDVPDIKNKIIVFGASDDLFVFLDEDDFPDVPIGRFPAQCGEQLDHIIDMNIQYLTNPNPGIWHNRMLILADDEYKSGQLEGCSPSSGLNHTAVSQNLAASINDAVWVDRVLGIEYEMNINGNKPEATEDLINKLNEGRLIWHYIGHGNHYLLGDENYFNVYTHLPLLNNMGYLPLFTAASSEVGNFSSLDFDCLAELFLTFPSGGAIACITPRSSTAGTINAVIFQDLFTRILDDCENLGVALLTTKHSIPPNCITTARLYNLLGDPLLFINPPQRDQNVAIAGDPDTLYVGTEITFYGDLPSSDFTNCTFRAFESEYECFYSNTLNNVTYEVAYTNFGEPYYEEDLLLNGNSYETNFTIPSAIHTGIEARMISYVYNDFADYVQYLYPVAISSGTSSSDDTVLPNSISAMNYPNPFNPTTNIDFSIPIDTRVRIDIFNAKGQLVKELLNEARSAGRYSVTWDGRDLKGNPLSSGIYYYRINTPDNTLTKKMTLLK